MKKLLFVVLICTIAFPLHLQSIPLEGLAQYSRYRKEIIKMGWIPVSSEFSVPEWTEIICAKFSCTATFRTPKGKKILNLSVLRKVGLDSNEYYVAPSLNFENKL